MKTYKGETENQCYIGTIRLILTDDSNINNPHGIPHCIYDPDSPVTIIGIPVLSAHFNNAASDLDAVAEDDGSKIISSGSCLHFQLDNGKHHHHFTHPDRQLPEISLYQGTNYFSDLCSLNQSVYNNKVNFAFLSDFSLDPGLAVFSNNE